MFPRVDDAFATSNSILDASEARDTEAEQIFVGYLLAIIHSEFEQALLTSIADRCLVESDPHLTAFARYSIGRVAKKFAISDLAGYLGAFDDKCKRLFHERVLNTEYHSAYDNIETNRQLLSHGKGSNLTWAELEETYPRSLEILVAFNHALEVPPLLPVPAE